LVKTGNASGIGYCGSGSGGGNIARVITVLYIRIGVGINSGDTADVLVSADGSRVVTVFNLDDIPSGNASDLISAAYPPT